MRREIHNFSMLTFLSAPNHMQHPPQTTGLISVSPESQPSPSDAKTQLSDFSQISAYASGVWRHSHLLVSFRIWGFILTSVNDWTPALMLHLTNPCAKRKVLSLTKPKGKIYKTKSLGHYITKWLELSYTEISVRQWSGETWVQSQVVSYQRLKKWFLIPPCLTLSNIRYVSRVKWSNPRKGVVPSPTPRCSSYWKGSLLYYLLSSFYHLEYLDYCVHFHF